MGVILEPTSRNSRDIRSSSSSGGGSGNGSKNRRVKPSSKSGKMGTSSSSSSKGVNSSESSSNSVSEMQQKLQRKREEFRARFDKKEMERGGRGFPFQEAVKSEGVSNYTEYFANVDGEGRIQCIFKLEKTREMIQQLNYYFLDPIAVDGLHWHCYLTCRVVGN